MVRNKNKLTLSSNLSAISDGKINNISQLQSLKKELGIKDKDKKKSLEIKGEENLDLATIKTDDWKYILVSCFTGWGTASEIVVNQYLKEMPDISYCQGLYPAGTEYSIQN